MSNTADLFISSNDQDHYYRLTDLGTMAEETVGCYRVPCESMSACVLAGVNAAKSEGYDGARITLLDKTGTHYQRDFALTQEEIEPDQAAWLINEILFRGETWSANHG